MKQQIVLVTGGAMRLGKAMVRHFASMGWEVAIHYNSSSAEAKSLSDELQKHYPGRNFPVVQANLCEVVECEALINNFDHLDALINSASAFEPGLLSETNKKLFRQQMAVNFDAPFFLMQRFNNLFKKGVIVNILDTRITNNDSTYGAYSLAKKALMSLTQMAASEWAPHVRVNAVAPGPVLPPEGKSAHHFTKVVEQTPLKKQVSIDNLCESVYFLTTNDDVTGQIIYCDGGAHLK
jgi:NAD(P)-dependent dehydrogenase (short-subunit alcohol dehydrogenase family)